MPASPSYRLLALCARAECDDVQRVEIARAAAAVTDWDALPALAEAHGMSPLLYAHTTAARVTLPRAARRELYALFMRHRLASQTRTRVLKNILSRCEAADIRVLVLKGAALCHLLYPEPGLRPMRDLDLLVSPNDLVKTQRLLSEMGFDAPQPATGRTVTHRHIGPATLLVDGFSVSVEIHHNLFEKGASPILLGLENLSGPPVAFSLGTGGTTAYTLGYADTLWYLCQHLVESTNIFSSVGLIWVADIAGFAERFAAEIDWDTVRERYPLALDTLSLLHCLTPLTDALVARARIAIGREPQGLWRDFERLPRTTPEQKAAQGYARTLRDAFFPSEWWLRLHFGVGSALPLSWTYRAEHLIYLVRRLNHVMQRRRRDSPFEK